ncbi:hypothetical protein ACG97_07705 [Vogesella sp. EB]|nr:hypothetical protein ACG97_07705 [Vogesella sp. EB]
MADETVVGNLHQFTDKAVRLDFGAFADCYATLYLDEGANESIIANGTAVQIDWLNDHDILTKRNINNSGFA